MELIYPLITLSFAYPWVFALPVTAWLVGRKRGPVASSLQLPSTMLTAELRPGWRVRLRSPLLALLRFVFVMLLTIAAARPQRISSLPQERQARNIVLALDLSRSMLTEDFESSLGTISRFEAVRAVVAEFVTARAGDRIGLVVFGSSAYLQSPLTLDHSIIRDLVQGMQVGMAGDGTALGDGLGLSIKRIQGVPADAKAIILLTDGVNTAGQVNPLKAAKVAREYNVRVHTIGVGSTTKVGSYSQGIFRHRAVAQAEFDEQTLRAIADETGGVYFHASSVEGLKKVYDEIDALETTASKEEAGLIVEELYHRYALAAAGVYLLLVVLSRFLLLKVP